MEQSAGFVLIAAFVFFGFFILLAGGRNNGADDRLKRWASASGYDILDSHFDWTKGPFTFLASQQQMVYRVSVRETGGKIRHGYVCFGGFFKGLQSEEVQVRWND